MPRTVIYFDPDPTRDLEGLRIEVTHGLIERAFGECRMRASGPPAPDVVVGAQLQANEIPKHILDALYELGSLLCTTAVVELGLELELPTAKLPDRRETPEAPRPTLALSDASR